MSRLSEALERVDQVIGERRQLSVMREGSPVERRLFSFKPRLVLVVGLIGIAASAFLLRSKIDGIQLLSAKVSPVKAPAVSSAEKPAPIPEPKVASTIDEKANRSAEKEELYRQGLGAAHNEDYDRAETAYRRLIELEPNSAEAFNNLGVIYVRRGAMGKGIEALRAALRIAPDYAEATLNLAVALERQGEVAEASQHYRRFLSVAGEKWKSERERVASHVDYLEKRKQ